MHYFVFVNSQHAGYHVSLVGALLLDISDLNSVASENDNDSVFLKLE